MLSAAERRTAISPTPPSKPRLQLQPDPSARTLLDGGWWPRSADPVAELPGLILAIDKRHGPITHIMLGMADWDASRPRRLRVDGPAGSRVVRLGWFETMPAGLLIATAKAGRTDLLTVPPHTSKPAALDAMDQAAQAGNRTHAPDLLAAITTAATPAHLPAHTPVRMAPDTAQAGSDQSTPAGRPHSFPSRIRRVNTDWNPGMDLTPMEQAVVAAAASGELADGGEGPFNLVEMRRWGEARTIRAAVLRYLLVENDWPVAAKGVRLRGVRISGPLDLEAAKLRCPLRLDRCYLDGPRPALGFASVSLLEMRHCHLAGLDAESLVVGADLDLSGSTFTCAIHLEGAEVGGQLNCSGAKLDIKDGNGDALIAEGIKVGGDLVLSTVVAAGATQLIGADITGQLNCSGAKLTGMTPDGYTLIASTIRVGGGVFLDAGFTADGAISLVAADVTAGLDCSSAKLNGADKKGNALVAFRMKVGTDVSFDRASTTDGTIKLTGADITGQLSFGGTKLNGKNKEGNALIADSVKVGGRVIIDGGFSAAGTVRLPGADITGDLHFADAHLKGDGECDNALFADSVKVGGQVNIGGGSTASGTIRLPGADITGRLVCGDVKLKGKDPKGRALLADGMRVGGGVWFGGVRTTCGAIYMVGADIRGDLLRRCLPEGRR